MEKVLVYENGQVNEYEVVFDQEYMNIILEESGRQFDPKLGPLFVQWVQDGIIRPILED